MEPNSAYVNFLFVRFTTMRDMDTRCYSDFVLAQRTVVVHQPLFIDRVVYMRVVQQRRVSRSSQSFQYRERLHE